MVVINQMMRCFTPELRTHIKEQGITTAHNLAIRAERYRVAHQIKTNRRSDSKRRETSKRIRTKMKIITKHNMTTNLNHNMMPNQSQSTHSEQCLQHVFAELAINLMITKHALMLKRK